MTNTEANDKIQRILFHQTFETVEYILGITKNTIYKRLRNENKWTKAELFLIEKLKESDYIRQIK